jgi:hypothetical protein
MERKYFESERPKKPRLGIRAFCFLLTSVFPRITIRSIILIVLFPGSNSGLYRTQSTEPRQKINRSSVAVLQVIDLDFHVRRIYLPARAGRQTHRPNVHTCVQKGVNMAESILGHTQQKMRSQVSLILLFAALVVARPIPMAAATPDPVLEWNAIMNTTILADHTNPLFTSRVVALVSASVFDAVNGIKPRYKPLHVRPDAPRHASQRAAAIQAAYAILIKLYPAQSESLTQQRDASIAAITSKKHALHR